MAYKLTDAKITILSLVDKGANGVPFAIIKSAGKNAIQKQVQIAKVDDSKRIVIGVVYQPDTPDAHDDQMTADEIEKAAHLFMENQHTYNIDKQHDLETDKGYVVESYIAPCDMEIGEQTIIKGSWVAGVKVMDDETWDAIQKGEITGFSMWGIGKREEIEEEEVSKGLLKRIAKALGLIEKGAVSDKYNKNRKNREFWAAQDALNSVLFRWDSWESGMETDAEVIREALQDFVEIAQEVLIQDDIVKAIGQPPEQIAKAGKKISEGNMKHLDDAIAALTELKNKTAPIEEHEEEDEVKAEDIAKAVQAAIQPIVKQVEGLAADVTELKKQEGEGADPATSTEGGNETQSDALADVIAKALAPLTDQMNTLAQDVQIVKNSRGGSAQGGASDEDIQKSAGGVSFGGLL
ncbi:XkdF-like putative serine protease domain-containing protein [Paenibacillus alvei]|uniref:XkdF-like putative serine protease domain-containing protein n=1 Tax=Paenibacillus alvei TaxID=44250 RepID=A0ABT4GWZ6_PAEAL|nr:XkdF-like putative serine protease domain-containing protein [Paenibacillus alvei]MCY9734639.1 XkdF-like putative serine protease domain-containing protein [Paenibacillus alvei]MCY9755343.1 XkdF-like putative serine protease domain-containing protein [Paenibacillus alvei]MCY9761235.1 XkdF-like putative serine protease domain-containing protein [Paenibacillus alvei]MCY9765720.1 XkdF-like putative serine protease domain-containing protein [Paenibacillus alvei]